METLKEYYYTYYSYEEWGRGYFGSRGCKCLPEEDVKYFGSFADKTFKPTQKIILKRDYTTREEAYADEIILQRYYKVVENPHFANRSYQTTSKFSVSGTTYSQKRKDEISERQRGRKRPKEVGDKISKVLREKYSKEPSPLLGKSKSEEHRKNLGKSKVGKPIPKSARLKILKYYENNMSPRAQKWRLTFENGQVVELYGLYKWAKENNYTNSALCLVYKNKRNRHKDVIKVEKLD